MNIIKVKYAVKFSKQFDKSFEKLDRNIQQRIITWIQKNLVNTPNPRHYGKSLQGSVNGLWRYRTGSYRIICSINDNDLIILALEVGYRKAIYR